MFLAIMFESGSITPKTYGLLFGLSSLVALLAMILVALTFWRMSRYAQNAEAHRIAAENISEFTRDTTQLDPHREPGPQLVSLIQSIFGIEAAAIFDADLDKVYLAGEWFDNLENVVRNIYFFETANEDATTGLIRRVLRMGHMPIGALLLRGEISAQTSNAIAYVVAVTFDRYHSFANVSRTESARQTEQLRTTVLDSLAHAYKTPLTAIRAASTGLSEMGSLTPGQSDLVTLIEEQSDVLNELTTRLLKTARLETNDLTLHKEQIVIVSLLDDILANFREQLAHLSVEVAISREDLILHCDRDLLETLLVQYLDNAAKYATAGSIVTIQAIEHPQEVVFSVHNFGPVISVADCERIFDRYFRCVTSASQVSGTGIGLSVAKHAAHAHGGDVWVTSDSDSGTTFFASLPITPQGEYSP